MPSDPTPEFIPLTRLRAPAPRAPWQIRRRELVAAPVSRVWRAILDPAEMMEWWCDFARVDARVGGVYAFGGPHVPGGPSSPGPGDFEVLELVPEARLHFRWRIAGVETRVSYELTSHLEMTDLAVTQTGERAPPGGERTSPNWWWPALAALRSRVEKGRADLRIDYAAAEGSPDVRFTVPVSTFPWIIWDKLTSPRELDRWWATRAQVDLAPGGVLLLGQGAPGPSSILEVEEGRRLVHDWKWEDGGTSRVEWRLEAPGEDSAEDVRVSVHEEGAPAQGARAADRSMYWASMLLALKQMSERGISPREYQDD